MSCETTHEASQFARERFLYWLEAWDSEWHYQVAGVRSRLALQQLLGMLEPRGVMH